MTRTLKALSTMLKGLLSQRAGTKLHMFSRAQASRISNVASTLLAPPLSEEAIHPYEYTDGRWLHHDRIQREVRHVQFNFYALCKRVIEMSPKAQRINRCEKKEGGFNRVFVFSLDNGERLVARIPFSIAGPGSYTVSSEVATMEYLRAKTTIPIPRIRDWSDDTSRIGCEYIIMEHAQGIQLHAVWPKMNTHQHMLCIKALTKIIQQMTQLEFPAYGSIYFVNTSLESSQKVSLGENFCIGAHTGTRFWDCDPSLPRSYNRNPPNRGPWLNIEEYSSALVDAGIAQVPDNPHAGDNELAYHGSVSEHLRLLEICRSIVTNQLPNAPQVRNSSIPTLYHPDLHARNIFVSEEDPSRITAIIDWQSTSIEPAFSYANEEPDMIDSSVRDAQRAGFIPSMFEDMESAESKSKQEKDDEICQKTFAVGLRAWSPALFSAKVSDENYFRLLRFAPNSWSMGAAAIRQELFELMQQWKELGLPGECAYQPSQEELLKHKKEYEDFGVQQRLKLWLQDSLGSNGDGWRPAEAFEAAEEAHIVAFEEWMSCNRDEFRDGNEEATEERARKLWPWDGNGKLENQKV